jgi:hypothetical protein
MSLTAKEMEQLKVLLSKVNKDDLNKEFVDGIAEPEDVPLEDIDEDLIAVLRDQLREKWYQRSDKAPPWIEQAAKTIFELKDKMFEGSIKDLVYSHVEDNPPSDMVEFLVDNISFWRIQKKFHDANEEQV